MKAILRLTGILLYVFISIAATSVLAQNYKAVKTDASYYFINTVINDIIAIRIDSVRFQNPDTLYYNFGQIRYSGEGCFTPYGTSWLGDPVIEMPDGTFLFKSINSDSDEAIDTLMIKTEAMLNEKWRFSGYPYSTDFIEAELIPIQPKTSFDVSELPAGIYLYNLTTSESGVLRGKIVRQ